MSEQKSTTESKMQSSNFLDDELHEKALKLVDYLNFERNRIIPNSITL